MAISLKAGLFGLDMRHRRQNQLGFPMSEDEFISVIQEVARRYRDDNRTLDLHSVQTLVPGPDPDGRVYREILDGILERKTGASPRFFGPLGACGVWPRNACRR